MRVDVAADVQLPAGQGEGCVELRVVVEVEGRELAIVERLVERGEPPDVLDQLVLASRLVVPADPRQEVAQGGDVVRLGDDIDRPAVQDDGLVGPPLRRPHVAEAGEGPVVARVRRQRRLVRGLGGLEAPHTPVLRRELPLGPRDTLGRPPGRLALLDGALEIGDGAGHVARE